MMAESQNAVTDDRLSVTGESSKPVELVIEDIYTEVRAVPTPIVQVHGLKIQSINMMHKTITKQGG